MPYRNELGEFDLCAICKHKGDEQECEGCEIPMACLNNFEAVEHLVAILQEMRPVAVGKTREVPGKGEDMSLSFCVQKIEPTDVGFTYHGFNEFRHRIARSIGLKDVYSLTETDMYHTGRYKEIETTHPMYPLIDHDDAEGDMGPDDCGQVGKYLKIIILEWRKELEDNFSAELKNDIDMAERLSEVMMQCYQHGETLLFM